SPLFQTMLVWQNTPQGKLQLRGLDIEPVTPEQVTAKFDLMLSMEENGPLIDGCVEYASAMFDHATVARWVEHWQVLLQAMAGDDTQAIERLPLLTAPQRRQVLIDWNATQADYPREQCIHELIEAQVRRSPDAVAVVHEGVTLSYAELNRRANRLAHALIEQGVMPDERVAICLPRSAQMMVSVLAVLKAGGAYVPLDPVYPAERLAFMLEDAAPRVLITLRSLWGQRSPQLAVIDLDASLDSDHDADLDANHCALPETDPDPRVLGLSSQHLAYVIYTSGSTGRPKGVMVEHASLCNQVAALQSRYGLNAQDRVLQFAPFTFDMSVEEIFGALCSGATLVLRTYAWVADAAAFWAQCERHGVTVANLPVSFWQLLARDQQARIPLCVRQIMIGGEAVSDEAVQRWHQREGWRPVLFNAYGPTEATVNATVHRTEPGSRRGCIGRPLANTRMYVLDAIGQPVPIGVAGELHIGGVQVARGYLNRAQLTAERFVSDPFVAQPARLYKSGDLARWRDDGTLEFLGRNDD
ncbi:MAG: amino acid adenylation domain-containing protein, partial [Burkholderiales bacterium]|nr:amino acid adenylation domain-containing protein [Burkholderiales bacterium]